MPVHRPHPIVGPWPYRDTEPLTIVRRVSTPYVRREPLPDSLIYDDPDDALLFDACERCEQHATHPEGSVDNERLAALWQRMVLVERDPTHREHYRTATEAKACRELYRFAILIERTHPGIDPWRWPWTFTVTGLRHVEGFPLHEPWHLDEYGNVTAGADEEG